MAPAVGQARPLDLRKPRRSRRPTRWRGEKISPTPARRPTTTVVRRRRAGRAVVGRAIPLAVLPAPGERGGPARPDGGPRGVARARDGAGDPRRAPLRAALRRSRDVEEGGEGGRVAAQEGFLLRAGGLRGSGPFCAHNPPPPSPGSRHRTNRDILGETVLLTMRRHPKGRNSPSKWRTLCVLESPISQRGGTAARVGDRT